MTPERLAEIQQGVKDCCSRRWVPDDVARSNLINYANELLLELARLRDCNGSHVMQIARLQTDIDCVTDDNARLRKAIEDAPHGQWCRGKTTEKPYDMAYCDCWKAKALGASA